MILAIMMRFVSFLKDLVRPGASPIVACAIEEATRESIESAAQQPPALDDAPLETSEALASPAVPELVSASRLRRP